MNIGATTYHTVKLYNIVLKGERQLIAKGSVDMKKKICTLVLSLNALVWIIISAVNYIGIMQQLEGDIIRIFIWSIIIVMMYGVIIYSLTLILTRIFLLNQYRQCKIKYYNNKAFGRQIRFLSGVIIYVYIVCLYNYHFLGLIPMFLFFSNILTNLGRLYILDQDYLLLIEDFSKEYRVVEIKGKDDKLLIGVVNTRSQEKKEMELNADPMENKFLMGFLAKEVTEEVVA